VFAIASDCCPGGTSDGGIILFSHAIAGNYETQVHIGVNCWSTPAVEIWRPTYAGSTRLEET
jgi:hypothetical protein